MHTQIILQSHFSQPRDKTWEQLNNTQHHSSLPQDGREEIEEQYCARWNLGNWCRTQARASPAAKHHTWYTGTAHLLTSSVKGSLLGLTKDAWSSWTFTLEHTYQTTIEKHELLRIIFPAGLPSSTWRGIAVGMKDGLRCFQSAKAPQNAAQGCMVMANWQLEKRK